jgi:hypothetical protein
VIGRSGGVTPVRKGLIPANPGLLPPANPITLPRDAPRD